MSSQNSKSKFFQLSDLALIANSQDDLAKIFSLDGLVTRELEIIFQKDLEILEYVIRTLTELNIKYKMLDTYVIVNCPAEERDFICWFVKMFTYLESTDKRYKGKKVKPNSEHYAVFESEYMPTILSVSKMRFGISEINVLFN